MKLENTSYTKNISSGLIVRIIKIFFGFFTNILVARALGPEGKGYIAYYFLIFTTISSYGDFHHLSGQSQFWLKNTVKNLEYKGFCWGFSKF